MDNTVLRRLIKEELVVIKKEKLNENMLNWVDNFVRTMVYGILDRRRDYLAKNIGSNPKIQKIEKEIEDSHKKVNKMVKDLAAKDAKFKEELEKNGYIWD